MSAVRCASSCARSEYWAQTLLQSAGMCGVTRAGAPAGALAADPSPSF